MRRRAAIAIPLLLALSAGCGGGDSVIPIDQVVRFVPASLDFGDAPVGEVRELATRLESTGGERLKVGDVLFDPPDPTFFARRSDGATIRGAYIEVGAPIDITVGFLPGEVATFEADLIAVFGEGEARLPLRGAGAAVEPARPRLSPSSILFQPAVELGRRITLPVTITNAGGRRDTLTFGAVAPPFSLEGGGGELGPGESRTVAVAFQPGAEGPASASIPIAFERGGSAALEVRGEGARAGTLACAPDSIDFGDLERGEAAVRAVSCTVSGGVFTVQEITMTPAVSRFTLGGAPAPGSRIDRLDLSLGFEAEGVTGTDRATLEILSAHGVRTSIALTGRVIPPEPMGADLKIRLEWSTPNNDFDLHLTRDGFMPFDLPHDCYFEHSHLDWGVAGDLDDDPYLDRDDPIGFGPEEINIGRATGPYDVYVHYYGLEPFSAPASDVTLTFWLRGARSVQMRAMSTCGNMWYVGRIDFRGGTPTFSPAATEVDTWSGRALRCP